MSSAVRAGELQVRIREIDSLIRAELIAIGTGFDCNGHDYFALIRRAVGAPADLPRRRTKSTQPGRMSANVTGSVIPKRRRL